MNKYQFDQRDIEYYELLSKQFPSMKMVCSEIINLQSILDLPKGTEHFMSDIHGEYEAFRHILNNCSGVIKEKIKRCFMDVLSKQEIEELATLIYYPVDKMQQLERRQQLTDEWYRTHIHYLVILIKKLSLKYTRSKVRKAIPEEYQYIIEELINERDHDNECQLAYQQNIIHAILSIHLGYECIIMMTNVIKRLAVDRLHIIGDIYDRGAGADKIMDLLMTHHHVDIQWGNHDVLWMGACCGNIACSMRIIKNCLSYHNEEILENSYGISLRRLERYARKKYPTLKRREAMIQCVTILLLKSEGLLIQKHPEYCMQDLLLLDKINDGTIELNGHLYKIEYLSKEDCQYAYNEEEEKLITRLQKEIQLSEKLNRHVKFLYDKGHMYLCCNNMLLYHGCVPFHEDGRFAGIEVNHEYYQGKKLFDYCEKQARKAYFSKDKEAIDFMFYLWSGYCSPLSGRKLKTFERSFIKDKDTWVEPRNPYYDLYYNEDICCRILEEFHMNPHQSHIINGHTPVKQKDSPVRANGKVIVIDGGFCKSYQKETGIAGYTLISNSYGLRLKSHSPFKGVERVLDINSDIHSQSIDIEMYPQRMLVKNTNIGTDIIEQMNHLKILLYLYQQGILEHIP